VLLESIPAALLLTFLTIMFLSANVCFAEDNGGIPVGITINTWFTCKRMHLVIPPSLYSFTSGILN